LQLTANQKSIATFMPCGKSASCSGAIWCGNMPCAPMRMWPASSLAMACHKSYANCCPSVLLLLQLVGLHSSSATVPHQRHKQQQQRQLQLHLLLQLQLEIHSWYSTSSGWLTNSRWPPESTTKSCAFYDDLPLLQ